MRQISIKQFLASRPACSIPLGFEFRRWFDAPLTNRQKDIITLLEYHRLEKRRAPYLIIHDPHNRSDVKEIIEAYLQWRNQQTAPGLRAALVTPKRFETNSSARLSSKPSLAGRVWEGLRVWEGPPIKHFTARSYRAAHGQTFGMVAALNCQQFTPKRKPEDGFADFPSIFIAMLDRTSPCHLLILHGCIPQGSNHSFARFMQRAAAQNAPYLIYDTLSRSFLTPENVRTHFNASTPPGSLRENANPLRISHADAMNCVPTTRPAPLPLKQVCLREKSASTVSPPLRGGFGRGSLSSGNVVLAAKSETARHAGESSSSNKQSCLRGGNAISPTLTYLP